MHHRTSAPRPVEGSGAIRNFNSLETLTYFPALAFCDPLQEVVDQLGAGVAHLDVERFHAVREVVEHPDGGDSDEQTDGGGDQGFGNTAGDRAQTGRLFRAKCL